ncbi:hypothetical protein K501DRAFT_266942 [Backusella circina FSU 941]|nr:hypothetical protein K501DRAFT_266942 [Backusella circina FSU 941]
MVDIQSFVLSLPSFVERSYFISPGIVSVIFKVIWSTFTFLVVTLLVQYGFASIGMKGEVKQKTIWQVQSDYTKIQSISNGRWGGMLLNLPSTRVILGFLFWLSIYAFELLFSLSIDNAYMTRYNGTDCVGRVDNLTSMTSSMWYNVARGGGGQAPATNSTLLRQLLNQKRAGNFALLGDGIFSISSGDAIFKKNQTINVARSGYNCNNNSTLYLKRTPENGVYKDLPSGAQQWGNFSTPTFNNITMNDVGNLVSGYLNLKNIYPSNRPDEPMTADNRTIYLLLISNPTNADIDINDAVYNSSVFLTECTLFYEYGQVTIAKDGYLNETNIGNSYRKVSDNTLDVEFVKTNIDTNIYQNKYFLSTIDFPDVFLNADYNKTYLDTLKLANNILSAHLLCGLDPNADLCTYNQEQIPVYISVLGTSMSFGYILVGVIFTVVSIAILFIFAIAMFTKEERKQWLLYSIDWRFTGYISKGSNMDQKEFKKYAMDTHVNNGSSVSQDIFEVNEDERLHSDTLLRKE